MSDPNEVPGGRPPVLMTGKEPPRPWRPSVAPSPQHFDPAAARSAVTAALRTGSLTSGLSGGRAALEASNRALAEVEQGIRPDAALKGWAERLPATAGKGGTKDGLAEELDQALLPLLDGARGALTRAAGRQRAEEDTAAGVAWVNEASRLAAQAPAELARETGQRIARILGPELGKLFLDKVAAWQARRDLEQDAARDLAADPRLAGVAPEVLADLERDRLRLAREQGLSREVEAARQRGALSRALAAEATAVTRGEAGPPRTREAFLDLYGAHEGETRWQLWQAHQAKAPAYALVRGRSPEEIAAAKAGYQGDATILERVEREDAAERARDPAGYALTWAKGYRRAYEEAQDPAEKAAILWEAQAAAGIPEAGRSPWTAEQGWALSERWFAIAGGAPHQVARARVALLREVLLGLPPEQRAAGVAQLVRLGLDAEAPGRIAAIAAAVEENRPGAAYAAAGPDYRPAKQPGLVQIADSGQIAHDGGPPPPSPQLAQDGQSDRDEEGPPKTAPATEPPRDPSEDLPVTGGKKPILHIEQKIGVLGTDLPEDRAATAAETMATMAALHPTDINAGKVADLPSPNEQVDVLRSLYRKAMYDVALSEQELNGVRAVYASLDLDDGWLAEANAKQAAANLAVFNDAEVQAKLAKWKDLSAAEKEATFQRVIDLVIAAYDLPDAGYPEDEAQRRRSVTLATDTDPDQTKAFGASAHFKPAGSIGTLGIIVFDMELAFGRGPNVINELMHELRHAYQQYYVNLLLDGKIAASDPMYRQAEIFALSDAFYLDVTNPERKKPDNGTYFDDPREADSKVAKDAWRLLHSGTGD